MRRIIALLLALSLFLAGCVRNEDLPQSSSLTEQAVEEGNDIIQTNKETNPSNNYIMNDLEMSIYNSLSNKINSENYVIEKVEMLNMTKEYYEAVMYNSKENVFFGYSLSELDDQFEGSRYIFTLGDNGQTVVEEFVPNKDTSYSQTLLSIAGGTGIILIRVTVSVITDFLGGRINGPMDIVFAVAGELVEEDIVGTIVELIVDALEQ